MKLALLFFVVLTSLSLWSAPQGTPAPQIPPPEACRGKPLSVKVLDKPGVEYRVPPFIPLRFGGTRHGSVWQVLYDNNNPFRFVIKSRDEFSEFWNRFRKQSDYLPPLPEVDFSKEMIVVVGLGPRTAGCCVILVDGVCEVDGKVEVFLTIVDGLQCIPTLDIMTAPTDIVRIPRSDLPIVYREIKVPCVEWRDRMMRLSGQPPIGY